MSYPEKKYVDGLFFNQPRIGAPDFVLGSISMSKAKFLNWLDNQQEDEKGYVKIDILMGKEDKPYCTLNTWKPQQR